MSEALVPFPPVATASGLEGLEVLEALKVLFLANPDTLRRSSRLLTKLLGQEHWALSGDLMTRPAEFVDQTAGPSLEPLLELPGNLALVRLAHGRFLLLICRTGRWFAVDKQGEDTTELPALPAGIAPEDIQEAVLLSFPNQAPSGLNPLDALRRVLRLAWAEVGIASLLINVGLLALPLFSMIIYNKVVYNGVYSTLWALALGMLLFIGMDISMRLIRNWATERIAADFSQRDDERIWRSLLTQNETPKGGFARLLSNYRELASVRDFVSSGYLLSLADTPFFFLYLLAIAIIAWPLALLVLVIATVYGLIGFRNHEALREQSREAEQAMIRKTSFLSESLEALDVIRLSPGAGQFDRRWRSLCADVARRENAKRIASGHGMILTVSTSTATSVLVLVAGVYLIEEQMTSVGGLIAVNLLAGRAMALISSLFSAITKMHDFRRAVSRLEEALEPPITEETGDNPLARPEVSGRIQVLNLSKRYPGRPPVLSEVSLAVSPGERIALLGRPGAGKTTLLRCLARLTLADSGQILYDGADLQGLDRLDMRRWLAYKAQDPVLFAGTLEDNLRIALSLNDPEALRRLDGALWASGLEDEFKSGRMNLSTPLTEHGRNLSGGQRQKVAVARAIAQGAQILLLDEPSLGLDPETERQLAERLPQVLAPESVLILISHSALMLTLTPRVVVLEGSRIVADGERDRIVRAG